ncbi:MAG: hypothetical protein OXK20_07215 [Deltaproteobacteria bacterium]|nr:hypothetical protein [Deltaproteobacteria bacterium]
MEVVEPHVKNPFSQAAWLVILLSCAVTSATAEEEVVDVGGTMVSIVAPDNWCTLEPGRVTHPRVVGMVREIMERTDQTFVVGYADCGELDRWQTAGQRNLENYGFVAYHNGLRKFVYPGTDAAFVLEMRKSMENVGQKYVDDLVDRAREVVEDIQRLAKLGKLTYLDLGIVGEDESSLYGARLVAVPTELGDRKLLAISYAATLLRKKVMNTYVYTRYDDAQVFPQLLKEHKSWMARLRAVN